jgi:hypothetical protein
MRTAKKSHRKRTAGVSISIDKLLLEKARKRAGNHEAIRGNFSAYVEMLIARDCQGVTA